MTTEYKFDWNAESERSDKLPVCSFGWADCMTDWENTNHANVINDDKIGFSNRSRGKQE